MKRILTFVLCDIFGQHAWYNDPVPGRFTRLRCNRCGQVTQMLCHGPSWGRPLAVSWSKPTREQGEQSHDP